ncbi:MAG: flagellar hook-associated protein FlgK [Deltaproteobacteria bacterium]|nr:flagellar hook-associated protein FlgK [Candidatus Anaeroferrophillus wilburensis]MBN2889610.1 flagellar hook-associated protein FlgK [Deltaproteobacteria bacterium]
MAVGLNNTLNTSRLSLLSQQTNIDIIGHNVANVNTPGYSRQVGILQTTPPLADAVGMRGTGVETTRIMNLYDRFIGMQLNMENSTMGMWQARSDALADLNRTFNEVGDYGLLPVIGEFWNAWEDLANNPEGTAQRVSVVQNGKIMTSSFNTMNEDLVTQKRILRQRIEGGVQELNNLTAQIAQLNEVISRNEQLGQDANDLRDRRNYLLTQLSGMIDINYFENEMAQVTVLSANGKSLVQGIQSYDLRVDADPLTKDPLIVWNDDISPMNEHVSGGEVRGWLDAWDDLTTAHDQLQELAAALIFHVNQEHVQGYGLDGTTGTLFFDHAITLSEGANNLGDGVLAFDPAQGMDGIDWATLANYDDFEIQFTADYGGVGDEFRILDTSTGEDLSPALIDTSVAGELAIDFNNGYFVKIVYDPTGTSPRAGDTFSLSFRGNAARTVEVNDVLEDPAKIAAADNPLEVPGNNRVALGIAQLQYGLTMSSQSATFNEFYASVVSSVGSLSRLASSNEENSALVAEQLQLKLESVSGVSIDEEMTNLMRFQQAYAASARIISKVDELMQSILQMV